MTIARQVDYLRIVTALFICTVCMLFVCLLVSHENRIEVQIGTHELGTNGFAIRYLHSDDKNVSIAWDSLGMTPQLFLRETYQFVQMPTSLLLGVPSAILALSWHRRLRRWRARQS